MGADVEGAAHDFRARAAVDVVVGVRRGRARDRVDAAGLVCSEAAANVEMEIGHGDEYRRRLSGAGERVLTRDDVLQLALAEELRAVGHRVVRVLRHDRVLDQRGCAVGRTIDPTLERVGRAVRDDRVESECSR